MWNLHVNIWVAAGAGLALGTLGGLLNGFLIAKVKLPALVATLGTYAFFRGIAYVLLGDQAGRGYPPAFTYLGQGKIPGTLIPFSVGLFAVLAVVFGLVLHRTTFGRYLFSIGNNENASIYAGVPVARIKMIIYTVSGFMAALAGLVLAARFGSTRPDIGTGLELSVITAAVLGGVDINGGIGTMPGAVLSLLLIGLMRFGMGLKNVQDQVQTHCHWLVTHLIHLARIDRSHNFRRWREIELADSRRWQQYLSLFLPPFSFSFSGHARLYLIAQFGHAVTIPGKLQQVCACWLEISLKEEVMKRNMFYIVLSAVAMLGMLLSACGSAATPTAAPAPATAAPAAQRTYVLVPKNLGNPYFDAANTGAQKAGKELGVTVLYQGSTTADATAQITLLNTLIAQKVSGLAISADDADALVPTGKAAIAAGIPVVTWDSNIAAGRYTALCQPGRYAGNWRFPGADGP